ncbi:MAG: hypothetical protein OXT65_06705 [Alphaproteobacteria bacterium]|nr:hypothetical protein [Alphaproteobacteria bacterium]
MSDKPVIKSLRPRISPQDTLIRCRVLHDGEDTPRQMTLPRAGIDCIVEEDAMHAAIIMTSGRKVIFNAPYEELEQYVYGPTIDDDNVIDLTGVPASTDVKTLLKQEEKPEEEKVKPPSTAAAFSAAALGPDLIIKAYGRIPHTKTYTPYAIRYNAVKWTELETFNSIATNTLATSLHLKSPLRGTDQTEVALDIPQESILSLVNKARVENAQTLDLRWLSLPPHLRDEAQGLPKIEVPKKNKRSRLFGMF